MGVKRDLESAEMSSTVISEDEAALYDRQIRLWGVDCQKLLRQADLFIVGLGGLGAEVVKNLVLSGVRSITLLDETPVSESDFSSQFFIVGSELGKSRAEMAKDNIKALNPNVQVEVAAGSIDLKSDDTYSKFRAVLVTDRTLEEMKDINGICDRLGVLFFCGDTWGMYGYFFLDLGKHEYHVDQKKKKVSGGVIEYKPLSQSLEAKFGHGLKKKTNRVFCFAHTLSRFRTQHGRRPEESDLLELQEIHKSTLSDLQCPPTRKDCEDINSIFGEISPVCSAVGGVLANEIVKGVSKFGLPACNFFFFDGDDCSGLAEKI